MGVECTFVTPDCTEEELNAAFRPNTKCVFGETIANPALTVLDIEKFAQAAHSHGVPLIVDNTFATPINCRPFEWGADIVTHSTTKYMDGHGVAVGGAIVDSGKFDWLAHAERFPGLCTPDDSYHGITYAEKFGKEGAFITKCTAQLMRDFGSIQSPQHAFYLNLGLESLHGTEGHDLGHVVVSVLPANVVHHLAPAHIAEIHIDIRHTDSLGIQEPFKIKAEPHRLNVCDIQAVAHHDIADVNLQSVAFPDGVHDALHQQIRDDAGIQTPGSQHHHDLRLADHL